MAFTVLPTDYAGAKAELLASRVTIGRQQAETNQLRATITEQAARLKALEDALMLGVVALKHYQCSVFPYCEPADRAIAAINELIGE